MNDDFPAFVCEFIYKIIVIACLVDISQALLKIAKALECMR